VIGAEVGRALGINPLELDPDTGLLYNENEEVEAQVIEYLERSSMIRGAGSEYIFQIRLDPRTGEDYMISINENVGLLRGGGVFVMGE